MKSIKKILLIFTVFSLISCQEKRCCKVEKEKTKTLSATAKAIKQYKLNFEWQKGYEMWSKVPCTEDYHMEAPNLNLEATGAQEIEDIIFGFVSETELKQELVDIVEQGNYVTCFLKLTTKSGETFDGVEVFLLNEKGEVSKIWAL
jgi:hypothetical protein